MASTPEQAVRDAIKTAGSERLLKFRDTVHLPFHQVGMPPNMPAIYLNEQDVPEYRDADWERSNPEWVGSKVKLNNMSKIIGDDKKVAFLIEAARYNADGSLMQTFNAIFTVESRSDDWRLISRNPFNITTT
jgi:hypothetical protein